MSEIIVGVDGTPEGEDAIAFARQLARATGATVKLAAAFPYPDQPKWTISPEFGDAMRARTRAMLEAARRLAGPGDVVLREVADPSPARALQWLAERDDAALIVVGSSHRGAIGRVFPGGTADRLLHGAPCPVAVVPRGYRLRGDESLNAVAAAYDGSEESRAAVAVAAQLAEHLGARLRVIRVFDAAPAIAAMPGHAELHADLAEIDRDDLVGVVESLPAAVSPMGAFLRGEPAAELTTQSEGVDLLVLGSRGYGPLRAVLLGSVSHRVVRQAACPVIVLPHGLRTGAAELLEGASQAHAG